MSNPFLNASTPSMEENTLDANNNNPLLKAEDPAKAAEEDGHKLHDDFEYVESEAVEGENKNPETAVFEDKVKNETTAIKNLVTESKNTLDALDSVVAVAQEMYAVMEQRGKLLPVEMMTINSHLASLEARQPWVGQGEVEMPSMEDFKTVGLQYTTSQVALEGVMDALSAGVNAFNAKIEQILKNGVGLAKAGLGLARSRKTEAEKLFNALDNSQRESGLKEVSGGFVAKLAVDGRAPDANTVLKTAVYANTCFSEILSPAAAKLASSHIQEGVNALFDSINTSKMDRPSGWLTFFTFLVFGPQSIIPVIKTLHDQYKTRKQIKVDPATAPQLFRVYPNVAKVNTSRTAAENLDGKHSLPLFGNKVIQIEQYSPMVSTERFNRKAVPSVRLMAVGKGASGSMQALTGGQQKDALKSAIAMYAQAEEYYRSFSARNQECYELLVKTYSRGLQFKNDNAKKNTPYVSGIITGLSGWYTRVFWAGIFNSQAEIAKYAMSTAGAIVDLVRASSKAAKANVEGKASQEAIALATPAEEQKNPFL